MNKKEALEIVRKNYPHVGVSGSEFETALRELVPELEESEDERIRKAISAAICGTTAETVLEANGVKLVDALSYLEKQKDEAQKQFNLGIQAGREEVMYEMEKEQKPADLDDELEKCKKNPLYFYDKYVKIKLKPVEWSEEDEKMLTGIIERGSSQVPPYEPALREEQMEWLNTRLKSLRPQPHWKPSDEQMEALNALNCHGDLSYVGQQGHLISLYNDIKKL